MTDHTRLREEEDGDIPVFFDQQLDREATRMAGLPFRGEDEFHSLWPGTRSDETNLLRTILSDGMVAGNKVSWEQDGKRQIGYWISRNSRGKGIASQALAQFLTVVKALPLYAYVANPNSASIRILDKKGSKRIGEETDHPPEAGQEPVELLFKLS